MAHVQVTADTQRPDTRKQHVPTPICRLTNDQAVLKGFDKSPHVSEQQ